MRSALFLLLVCGCAKHNSESLVLQGKVADNLAPAENRGCPWGEIETARVDPETLWINDSPWSVKNPAAGDAFASLLAVCGSPQAVQPFRAWRAAELEATEAKREVGAKRTAETIGTVLVAGAASAAAQGATQSPVTDALSNAVRDQNLQPTASPITRATDPALLEARQAIVDALLGTAKSD